MGIVNELQECAEADDVLTALRKAKRLASKLARDDISDWIEHELGGYPKSTSELPDYRIISSDFAYNTNGYIPAGGGRLLSGIVPIGDLGLHLKFSMRDSISTVLQYIEGFKEKSGVYLESNPTVSAQVKSMFHHSFPEVVAQVTILHHLHPPSIKDISQQVSNRILDWALKVERAGIHGEAQSFSKQEQQQAQQVIFNDYSTTISTRDVHGAIQASSPHATQRTSVTTEVTRVIQQIDDAVSQSRDVDDIDKAEIKSSLNLIRELSAKEQTSKTKHKLTERLTAVWLAVQTYDKLAPHVEPAYNALKHLLHLH